MTHDPNEKLDRSGGRPTDEDVEKLLMELRPVDPPPFHTERLLARLRQERERPAWSQAMRSPRLAWSIAAVCVAALAIVLSLRVGGDGLFLRGGAPDGDSIVMGLDGTGIALATDVAPVMPVDNAVVGASDVEIVAAIQPPLEAGGIVRLLVDDRDVTSLADITESSVMYSPAERLEEGEHIITIEITDGSGRRLRNVSWLFYALNGGRSHADERV